jgi:hypothetical protein
MPDPRAIGRLQPALTDPQAHRWAEKLLAQALTDPEHRGPRFWGTYLGLVGPNLDRVLAELGEPPAPPLPAVLRPRRAFFVRRLFLEA